MQHILISTFFHSIERNQIYTSRTTIISIWHLFFISNYPLS